MKHYDDYIIIENNYDSVLSNYTNSNLYILGKGKNKYGINFIPSGFDIETSTIYEKDENGNVISHSSFMYIWQFIIGEYIFIGRTWEDFSTLLSSIEKNFCKGKEKFLCFIHNMDFEFQFFSKVLEKLGHTINVFARKKRKPMKTEVDEKIIFIDSYKLTRFSLKKLAENYTKTQKLVGDLDYSKIRHSETPLTDKELSYCYNDVIILKEYAEYYEKEYLSNSFLPLTQTMRANKVVKDKIKELKCQKDVYYMIKNLYPKNRQQYEYMMLFYSGAYTHGMLKNLFVTHKNGLAFDVTSEYPYVMMAKYYPMGTFKTLNDNVLNDKKRIQIYLDNYCCLCDVILKNVKTKNGVTILSQNKLVNVENGKWDNGRLYSCNSCRCFITEVDILTLSLHYTFEIYFNNLSYSKRGYLPDYFRLAIAELYSKKSTLKDKKGYEIEYMESKQELNGQYGACCTRLEFEELYFDNGWKSKKKDIDFDKISNSKNKLPQWAIWITAHSRYLILSTVAKIKPIDYWYSDTDSIKCANKNYILDLFEKLNNEIMLKNEKWINDLNLKELYPSVNFELMGTFSREDDLINFKCLGSKRYLSETKDGIEQTIAGLPKGKFIEYCNNFSRELSPFDLFNEDGISISDSNSGKLTTFYKDETDIFKVKDYLGNEKEIITYSSVSLIPISFNLNKDTLLDLYMKYKNELESRG